MEKEDAFSWSFTRSEMAKVIEGCSSIKIDDAMVPINPALLFHRILVSSERDPTINLETTVGGFELTSVPPSLFEMESNLMRKPDKPKLTNEIWANAGVSVDKIPDGN